MSDNHYEYDQAQLPRYARDPEYIDDALDPLRAAAGILRMTVIAIIFWSSLCGLVWLANTLINP